MPRYSSFAPYGMLRFSSEPSSAEKIYRSMREMQGGDDGPFAETGYQGAKLYAQSMGLARIAEFYQRIKDQHTAKKVTWLLAEKEEEHGITPDTALSDADRRNRLGLRMLSGRGALESVIRDGLTSLLGTGFVDVIMTDDPDFLDLVNNFSATPPAVANFALPSPSHVWGIVVGNHGPPNTAFFYVPVNGVTGVASSAVNASITNKTIVFGGHNGSLVQKAVAVNSYLYDFDQTHQKYKWFAQLSAPFTDPVQDGQGFTSSAYPFFPTGRRRVLIEVTPSVTKNAPLLAAINDFMHHTLRATTAWQVTSSASLTPGFLIGQSLIGFDMIGVDP